MKNKEWDKRFCVFSGGCNNQSVIDIAKQGEVWRTSIKSGKIVGFKVGKPPCIDWGLSDDNLCEVKSCTSGVDIAALSSRSMYTVDRSWLSLLKLVP